MLLHQIVLMLVILVIYHPMRPALLILMVVLDMLMEVGPHPDLPDRIQLNDMLLQQVRMVLMSVILLSVLDKLEEIHQQHMLIMLGDQ